MSEFSITDVATEGFRVTRANPVAVAIWSILEIILQVGMAVAMVKSGFLAQIQVIGASGSPDPTALVSALGPLESQMLWFFPLCLVVQVPLRAAILRAILRPAQVSPGYLRLGGDELRLFALQFILGLASFIAAALLMGTAVFLARVGVIGPLLSAVVIIGGACAVIFVLVRLSFAPSQTFATRHLNLFGSWKLTQGRFWPLIGCYLLAFVFYLAVLILGSIVGAAIGLIGGGHAASATSLATYFTAANVVEIIVQGVIAALGTVLLLAAPAGAYKTITQGPDVDMF